MSTEHDETRPIPTGAHGGDQPTAPIPRAGARRDDDPTRLFETFGSGADGPHGRDATDRAAGDRDRNRDEHEAGSGPSPATASGPGSASTPLTGSSAGTTSTPGAGATATSVAAPDDGDGGRPALRVGTVVWGLVLAIIGVGLVATAAGARVDVELALIGLLALAGVGLVAGSVAVAVRQRR